MIVQFIITSPHGRIPPRIISLQNFDDLYACGSVGEYVSLDDHLFEISVPELNLKAGGGQMITGNHTRSLTAGIDLTYYW